MAWDDKQDMEDKDPFERELDFIEEDLGLDDEDEEEDDGDRPPWFPYDDEDD